MRQGVPHIYSKEEPKDLNKILINKKLVGLED